jgi:hypothetical protein
LLIIPAMYCRFGKWLFPKPAIMATGERDHSPTASSRTIQRGDESKFNPR